MKTKFILPGLAAFLLVACDNKRPEAAITHPELDLGANAFFLTTDLPPEQLDGTPGPVVLHGVNHTPIAPGQSSGPGTRRVIYRQN